MKKRISSSILSFLMVFTLLLSNVSLKNANAATGVPVSTIPVKMFATEGQKSRFDSKITIKYNSEKNRFEFSAERFKYADESKYRLLQTFRIEVRSSTGNFKQGYNFVKTHSNYLQLINAMDTFTNKNIVFGDKLIVSSDPLQLAPSVFSGYPNTEYTGPLFNRNKVELTFSENGLVPSETTRISFSSEPTSKENIFLNFDESNNKFLLTTETSYPNGRWAMQGPFRIELRSSNGTFKQGYNFGHAVNKSFTPSEMQNVLDYFNRTNIVEGDKLIITGSTILVDTRGTRYSRNEQPRTFTITRNGLINESKIELYNANIGLKYHNRYNLLNMWKGFINLNVKVYDTGDVKFSSNLPSFADKLDWTDIYDITTYKNGVQPIYSTFFKDWTSVYSMNDFVKDLNSRNIKVGDKIQIKSSLWDDTIYSTNQNVKHLPGSKTNSKTFTFEIGATQIDAYGF